MPDAMMNGGFAPYLAQAFTPQGVPGGLFGSGMGNTPGNIFSTPTLGQNFGLGGMPQFGQQYFQPFGWQQQTPQFGGANPLGQFGTQGGFGWPYGQTHPGQPFGQPHQSWQEPHLLAHLLRQYAMPIACAVASPYGQPLIAQNIMQTADMLTRLLPQVGAPQLIPLAQALGQCAQPISAAITSSPYGQAHIAQNIARTAEFVERAVPLFLTHQLSQSFAQPWQQMPQLGIGQGGWPYGQAQSYGGWQQHLLPQLPIAQLLGQPQQQLGQQPGFGPWGTLSPWGNVGGGQYGQGQYGQGQFGQFPGQSGDALTRMLPFLAQQQGLAGQGYGMARA
jgi:hypothetical protein